MLCFSAGVQMATRQHRRREIGRAQQGATHLLHDDAQLDHAKPRAAVVLRDVDPGQRELFAELAPGLGIVPLGGVHETPDLGRGRLFVQKAPNRRAELFLLISERELDTAGVFEFRWV